jgi:sec-independent protein translocase protein TatB
MFDIGWTEMLVIAVVMIVVVGPKDLPKMLRTFGKMTTKMRSMAGDFQRQFNEAMREAELDDVKKSIDELKSLNPANEIRKQLNPLGQAAADLRAGIQSTLNSPARPDTSATPAAPTAQPAEPLKAGPVDMPAAAAPAAVTPPAAGEPPVAASVPVESVAEPAKPKRAAPKRQPARARLEDKTAPAVKAKAAPVAAKKPRAPRKTGGEA